MDGLVMKRMLLLLMLYPWAACYGQEYTLDIILDPFCDAVTGDADFVYVCSSANHIKRVALGDF
jgi:hypothetical protein